MVFEMELLDALLLMAGCRNLSDLRYLDGWQRAYLARRLGKIPPYAAALKEWNDALMYLSREPPQETVEAARDRLIQSLSLADWSLGHFVPKPSTEKQQEENTT